MVPMAARLRVALSGLLLACSCEGSGLRSTPYDAGDTGGSSGSPSVGGAGGSGGAATSSPDAAFSVGGSGGFAGTTSSGGIGGIAGAGGTASGAGAGGSAVTSGGSGGMGGSGGTAGAGGAGGAPVVDAAADQSADVPAVPDEAPPAKDANLAEDGPPDVPSADAFPDVMAPQGVFAPTGSMVTPRDGHTATLLGSGMVLVAGGENATGHAPALASAELYDPAAGRFTATGSMKVARAGHTATRLGSGMVLIAGGGDGSGELPASA